MDLLSTIMKSINTEWENQPEHQEPVSVLTTAYISPKLARLIQNEGNEVPKEFNPNTYNDIDGDTYAIVDIQIREGQEELLEFHYE